MEVVSKSLAVTFALAFSGLIAAFTIARFDGWASRRSFGRATGLALLSIAITIPLALFTAVSKAFAPATYHTLIEAYGMAAFSEETARLLAIALLMRGRLTDDPREFISGLAALGLGFGVVENIMYLSSTNLGIQLGATRGVLSAPAHLAFSFVTGLGVWRATRMGKSWLFMAGMYMLAIAMHGSFNFSLMSWPAQTAWEQGSIDALSSLGIGLGIISVILFNVCMSIFVFAQFIGFSDVHPAHDAQTGSLNMRLWQGAARLLLIAAGIVLIAFAIHFYLKGFAGLKEAPVAIGVAASLFLWSRTLPALAACECNASQYARPSYRQTLPDSRREAIL